MFKVTDIVRIKVKGIAEAGQLQGEIIADYGPTAEARYEVRISPRIHVWVRAEHLELINTPNRGIIDEA